MCGTRTFSDYPLLRRKLDVVLATKVAAGFQIIIIHGGCNGADKMAERYAKENGYRWLVYPADWSIGKSAGPIRNAKMIANADALIAFWDGKSVGTADAIIKASRAKLPTRTIMFGRNSNSDQS